MLQSESSLLRPILLPLLRPLAREVLESGGNSPSLSLTAPRSQTLLVIDGDSKPEGGGVTAAWPQRYANKNPGRVPNFPGNNLALGGSYLSSVIGRGATADALLTSQPAATSKILAYEVGANNVNPAFGAYYPSNAAGFLADSLAYANSRKLAGFKVVAVTIQARSAANLAGLGGYATDVATWDAWRAVINAGYLAAVGVQLSAVINFADDPFIGLQSTAENPAYLSDGLHPTDALHILMEAVAAPVLNGLTVARAQPAPYSAWSTTDKAAALALSNANRTIGPNGAPGYISGRGAAWRDFGKHSIQMRMASTNEQLFGLVNGVTPTSTHVAAQAPACVIYATGGVFSPGVALVNSPPVPFLVTDVPTYHVDFDAGKAWVSKNGIFASGGDPVTGVNPTWTFSPNTAFWVGATPVDGTTTNTLPANAGELLYPLPTGYAAW